MAPLPLARAPTALAPAPFRAAAAQPALPSAPRTARCRAAQETPPAAPDAGAPSPSQSQPYRLPASWRQSSRGRSSDPGTNGSTATNTANTANTASTASTANTANIANTANSASTNTTSAPTRSASASTSVSPSPTPSVRAPAAPPAPPRAPQPAAPPPPALPYSSSPSQDLRMDLWVSLLQAGAQLLASSTSAASTAVSSTATRLQRLVTPPPPGFPAGPPGDATVSLLSDPLAFLADCTQRFGPVVGLLLGGERVVLVTGRDEARAVLVEQASEVYVKEGTAFFPGSSLAGNGLLVSDGPVWQRQRRLSNPAFRRAAVDAYGAAMVAATTDMMQDVWRQGGTRDVYEDYNELTLRVTLDALFGFGGSAQGGQGARGGSSDEAQQIVSNVEKAFTFFTQRAATGFVIPEWLPTWDNLEFAAAVQQLDRVVYGMIGRRRAELAAAEAAAQHAGQGVQQAGDQAAAAVPSDLLTSLLLSRDEDGSGMADTALRDELMTLLVAGQETSAILLGWASALLAAHPAVQARAAEEVAAVCGGEAPSPASVRRMPYLESVVLEGLRLYSPAYMVGRCARCDAQLGAYRLPAGTTVLVSPYVMHRDAAAWEQPDSFRPERWHELQGREGYQGFMTLMSGLGPNGSYLPFGGGPRNCIGTGFAMVEALLVLASVLQRYSLELPPGGEFPKPKPLLTLRPEKVVLRLSARR